MQARRTCRRPASCSPAIARSAEAVVIPLLAILVAAVLFSIFLLVLGKSPVEFFTLLWRRRLRHRRSRGQNTLVRAAPLIFTALCVAIPARLGMVVIGGEGALVLGGFAAAAIAIPLIDWASPWITMPAMIARRGRWSAASGSASSACSATIAASTRRSPACSSSTSPSRS